MDMKKKRGRPPRVDTPSDKYLSIRTTDEERRQISAIAAKKGMNTAQFIRSLFPEVFDPNHKDYGK